MPTQPAVEEAIPTTVPTVEPTATAAPQPTATNGRPSGRSVRRADLPGRSSGTSTSRVYYKDPETGIYVKPWVRVHAAKDYVDMAAMLKKYPKIHVTFNLTPSLLRQLDDLAAGAKDLYWVTSEVPADQLTDEQKQSSSWSTSSTPTARSSPASRATRSCWTTRQRPSDAACRPPSDGPDSATCRCSSTWPGPTPTGWPRSRWQALVDKGRGFSEEDKASRARRAPAPDQGGHPDPQAPPGCRADRGHHDALRPPHPAAPGQHRPGDGGPAGHRAARSKTFFYGQDAVAQVQQGVAVLPGALWPAAARHVAGRRLRRPGDGRHGLARPASSGWRADEGVLAYSPGHWTASPATATTPSSEADNLYRPYYVQEGRRRARGHGSSAT